MSKKIKILHILPNLSGGGAEKVCQQILLGLNKEKFAASLLLFKDNDLSLGKKDKEKLKENNIEIISIKKRYLFDPLNFFKIVKSIRKVNPDIIHTHLGADIYGPLASYFVNKNIKIVSTEHNINKTEKKLAKVLKKFTLKKIYKVCAVSLAVKNDAIKRYNINKEKIELVYNGVDLDYFKVDSNNKNINKEKIIIGAMGRLCRQKGHKILIEAFSKVNNDNLVLEIAGEGGLKSQLQDQINNLKLNNKVRLVGQVNNREWFNNINIFVMPSLWEGLGLAVLEAAACHKPIIASSVDGILEILNEENSFLYKKNDNNELTQKLNYLTKKLNHPSVEEKVSKAYNLVKNKFSLNKMIENYQNIYENTASQ